MGETTKKPSKNHGDEIAWLQLVHTKGIGPKNAWKIYKRLQSHGLKISDILQADGLKLPPAAVISDYLSKLLRESASYVAEERFEYLQQSSLRLLHPYSSNFNVPEIPGLPPTLALWGDLGLLNSPDAEVLMKSRDTSDSVLKAFLQCLAQGKIPQKTWCFCPFSCLDWELVESMLKLECGLILGLVSGISRRAQTLAHETPAGRLVILAPEPPLRGRGALFACNEALYRLFCMFTRRIFLLQKRAGGKTARRLKWAAEMGCRVSEFSGVEDTPGKDASAAIANKPIRPEKRSLPTSKPRPDDELKSDKDDSSISCL